MPKIKKMFCFTHFDMDGAVSYLVTKWAHPGYKIECKPVMSSDIRYEVTQWLVDHNFADYDKVIFLDLDASPATDLIDHNNVLIIDHHKTHAERLKYKNAAAIVKEYPSAALLAYRLFRKLYDTKFTAAQKILMLYANDYDSYTLEFKESQMLNVMFWNTQKTFENYIQLYANGFKPFTKEQLAIYRIYENELKETLDSLKAFQGSHADVDGEYRVVVAAFANKHINDVATHLLNKYNADVSIVINLKTQRVSFRRPKDGTMKLDAFAKDIADGGGHEYSAGGSMTESFLNFTKTLKPLTNE